MRANTKISAVHTLVVAMLVLAVAMTAMAEPRRRTRTIRGNIEKRMSTQPSDTQPLRRDTLCSAQAIDAVTFSGFNKPLRSRLETFLVTNNLAEQADTITTIVLTINYTDTHNNQLHRAVHTIREVIPPGQTRSITVPSWDRQRVYYYVHGKAGRTPRNVMPFDVAIRPDTVFVTSRIKPNQPSPQPSSQQ